MVAEGQENEVKLPYTLFGCPMPRSLITRSKAEATNGEIREIAPMTITDNGRVMFPYVASAAIDLRWYYDGGAQSWAETFYIVDEIPGVGEWTYDGRATELDAILRDGVRPPPRDLRIPVKELNRGQVNEVKWQAEKAEQHRVIRNQLLKRVEELKQRQADMANA